MIDITSIALAIKLSAPHVNDRISQQYAKVIYQQAIKKNISPLLVVAIARHESHWNSTLVSNDLEDYGLMQVRAKFISMPSARLLDGSTNIMVGVSLIDSSREFCRNHLDREPEIAEFVSCYQGSCGSKKKYCKPTNLSIKVVSYAQCLYDSLMDQTSYPCNAIYQSYKYNEVYPVKYTNKEFLQ